MAQNRAEHTNPIEGGKDGALLEAIERQKQQLNEIRELLVELNLHANNRPPAVDRIRAKGVAQGQPVDRNRVCTRGFSQWEPVKKSLRRPPRNPSVKNLS